MFDYETLRFIWWLLIGVILVVFMISDGFDMGLGCLFFRPRAFDYRGSLGEARWRNMWDAGLVVGSLVPPVVFGIAFGNLLLGVPSAFTPQLRVEYLGSFWQLLPPFPLLCGLL